MTSIGLSVPPQDESPSVCARLSWRMESIAGLIVELSAATIVVAEIAVLSASIMSRIIGYPILWADEVASILFIWLAMLGAGIATRRCRHMRMTAFVERLKPKYRPYFELMASVAGLLFVLFMLPSAFEYAQEETFVATTVLEISNGWRAAALPVGLMLMAFFVVLQLLRAPNLVDPFKVIAAALIVLLVARFLSPVLPGLGNVNLLIFFVGIVGAFVLCGVPIAFAFGAATFGYIALTTQIPTMVVSGRMDEGMSHLILLAVPLFVFLGLLIEMAGMARAMVEFLASLLGHLRGGLSCVLVGAMYLVSGISGSKAADMAAVAPVLIPEMEKRGYERGELVALLSSAGAQTETVPPSLVLIMIGSVTGVSIAALFTGGLLPSALLGLLLCALAWYRSRVDDSEGPRKIQWSKVRSSFIVALPALALPFIIRAAVVEGVATATEVSTIGVAYTFVVGLLVYRQFDWRRLIPMLIDTAALSGSILIIIGTATGMAWALTQSGFSHELANAMVALPGGATTFMLVSVIAFIVLGSVLEGIPAIVLFGPLLFPIARSLGIHEVHYAMVVVLAMGLGLFAPPFGVGYYSACAISGINPNEGMKPIIGYLAVLAFGVLIVAAVPWLSIGLL